MDTSGLLANLIVRVDTSDRECRQLKKVAESRNDRCGEHVARILEQCLHDITKARELLFRLSREKAFGGEPPDEETLHHLHHIADGWQWLIENVPQKLNAPVIAPTNPTSVANASIVSAPCPIIMKNEQIEVITPEGWKPVEVSKKLHLAIEALIQDYRTNGPGLTRDELQQHTGSDVVRRLTELANKKPEFRAVFNSEKSHGGRGQASRYRLKMPS